MANEKSSASGSVQWIGLRVEQVRCVAPEYQKFVGRKAIVTDSFVDEKGNTHVQTDDGVWCPVSLVSVIAAVAQ